MDKINILNRLTKRNVFWVLLVILFFLPYIGISFNEWFGWSWGNIITITPNSKVFLTIWTTTFGVIGLIINIIINNNRLTNQQKQLSLQSKNERNSRFSKAIELLGNNHESARIGAVHTLISLAKEYKEEYKELVFNILCSHIRTTTCTKQYQDSYSTKPSNEIQTIIEILFKNEKENKSFFDGLEADLNGSFLTGLYLNNASINNANLKDVNLSNSKLTKIDFISTNFLKTNLRTEMISDCNFRSSVISESHFENTTLSRCHFEDSFISYTHFEITKMYNPHFEGAIIINTHFEGAIIDDGHFEGTDITASLFICSEISKTFFNGASLKLSVRFSGAVIDEVSFDGAYLNRVYFEGCAINEASLLGGGDYEFSDADRKRFNIDRTSLLTQQINKETSFSDKLYFGFLDLKLTRILEKRMQDCKVDIKIINDIYSKFSEVQHIKSSQDNFIQGILDSGTAEKSIRKLKEVEINCNGWRQNRNKLLMQ